MKKKEIQELKLKPKAELEKLFRDGRNKLRVLKFDLQAGRVKSAQELRSLKKDLARILTFLNLQKN